MNTLRKTDFFPETREQDLHLVAPDNYQPYQETEEDFLHEKHLNELKAEIDEKFGIASDDEELGELRYDEEADRKRWIELEKDFDRLFEEAEKNHS